MFNQKPTNIIQTNRLPFLIGIIVLIVVMGIFMYKTQMNQKVAIVQQGPHQSIDISSKQVQESWFNDEKFKNIRINAMNPPDYNQQLKKLKLGLFQIRKLI